MEAPGINQQDNGYMEPPPAYDDIANQQPTTPRPVPRTSLARSAQVSTSLMNMRNGQLIPQQNGGPARTLSSSRNDLSGTNQNQRTAALPSKSKPQFDSTSRISNSPCESERSCSFKKHDTSGNSAATFAIPTQVVGIVNGTKGKVKENIQRSTGTTIQFIEDERNSTITGIRISGGSSGIAHAESYIFDLLKSARQLQEYESENIGSEFLPKIASWEKAKIIHFFKETTVFFEIRSGVVFFKGFSAEDVENAEKKLYEMLTEEPENSILELKIPSSQGGIIAGTNHSLVTKLKAQTGARIELLPQDLETTVRITGVPSCVADAAEAVYKRIQLSNKLIEKVCDSVPPVVAMVNEWTSANFVDFYIGFGALVRCSGTTLILRAFSRNDLERAEVYLGSLASEYGNVNSERKAADVFEIYVPDSLIGLIIGKGGANIKRMQEQTGAKIVTPRESDGSGQTKVRLEGSEEAISAAKAAIEQLQIWAKQNKPSKILPENKKVIRISKSLCGLIVGKGGKTIESMKTKSGAGIMIEPADVLSPDFEISVIRVSGDSSNIAEAERLIYHQLKRVKELKKMPCNSVPAAALSEWRLAETVKFFSKTGCFLEVTGSDVEIRGFDIDEMIVAEEELQNMVEDASRNNDATRINEEPGTRSDPDGENEEIENDNNTDRSTQDSGNQDGEDEDDGQSTRSKKDGSTSGSEDSDEDQEDGPSACSYEDELKPLWAGNLQYMKLDRTEPFQPNECFDLIENSTVINNFVPKKLPLDGSGSIVFLVSADTFKNGKDVGFDSLRPWRGKDKDGQLVAPKIDKDMIGGRWFKTIRATHHDNRHIRKLQRYWMDEKGLPTSPVLHQYMFLADGIELPKQESRVFTLPSARDEINEALSHRTTTAAKKYLAEEGIEFKPKTVTKLASNHPTVIKQGSGPRVATDVEKLREMRKSNPNILIHEGKENGEGNDEDLRVICTFPEVISLFLHSCPTGTQIKQHRIEMSELEKMDDDATESFLETLTRRKTVSQTIPKMGSHAQSDTTFEVSHLLLTIVVGVIDNFVTKTSGKSSSAVLAIMLHPSKEERHHEALGKAIEGQMKIIAPHRRVPAYVTDGEKSLQAIAKGQAFELSARLGCDLHKKGNLIDKFGKILGETLAPALFGKKAESDDGFIYARGILGMCQRSRFDEEIAKLTTVHPRLHKWVNHRKEDLWTRHSLRAKLDGGFLAQYLTSNIVEQRNQELKLHLKSRCPGEVVLELFLQKDKLEVDKFLGAVAGGSSSVRLANHVANQYRSEEEWTGLTCVQKKAHLAPFGIDFRDEITEMVTGAVPAWIFKGFSPARKEEFAHSVTKLKVYDLDDFFLVKFPNDSGSNVEVKRERGLLECTGMCRMNKKTAACEHIVAVLMFLDVDKRATALDVLTRKEQNKTEKQILASSIQKEDGGKGGRKSGDFSKSNVGRTEKRFTTFDFSASLRGKRGAADEGAAGTSSDAIPSKRAAPDNGEITETNMARYQTAHDLGRLNLNQQKTSQSSTTALREMSDDEAAQSETEQKERAAPPELNKPKLVCDDIACMVNPMLESWYSDELIDFQRETCTTIYFDYSSLTLEGLCMKDLYAAKDKLFHRARLARETVMDDVSDNALTAAKQKLFDMARRAP